MCTQDNKNGIILLKKERFKGEIFEIELGCWQNSDTIIIFLLFFKVFFIYFFGFF